MANHQYHIGGSPPLESYLRKEKIIETMLRSGAQAVHPGYGFLSENPEFANMCKQNDLVFIGPPSAAMDKMASKSESKDIMIKAGVPVTPGYHGENQDPQFLLEQANKIQYPVIIKFNLAETPEGHRGGPQ
jgi:3-methylcrotonyl-CoA carboxylase alpha subunit